jgi:hypothetical protein
MGPFVAGAFVIAGTTVVVLMTLIGYGVIGAICLRRTRIPGAGAGAPFQTVADIMKRYEAPGHFYSKYLEQRRAQQVRWLFVKAGGVVASIWAFTVIGGAMADKLGANDASAGLPHEAKTWNSCS